MDKDVIACADAALEDYKKATLLLRLPGSIDIPSFASEIKVLEAGQSHQQDLLSQRSDAVAQQEGTLNGGSQLLPMDSHLESLRQRVEILKPEKNRRNSPMKRDRGAEYPSLHHVGTHILPSTLPLSVRGQQQLSIETVFTPTKNLKRIAIDVPMVVRKAVNTREDVLRALGVDEETIRTKKMVLVSFGGQRLKQGWGNPLPEGWIGVICGLPVSHELPEGFYRSPHGVYVPDLTHAADIVIGKLVSCKHVCYCFFSSAFVWSQIFIYLYILASIY
jgi:hypothetical protein